jgi:syntaxin 5
MQHVEATIAELRETFGKMASLVAEQGEVVDRIDTDAAEALGFVQAGQEQLLQMFQRMSGDRGLILKLFAVLIFVITLFLLVY